MLLGTQLACSTGSWQTDINHCHHGNNGSNDTLCYHLWNCFQGFYAQMQARVVDCLMTEHEGLSGG